MSTELILAYVQDNLYEKTPGVLFWKVRGPAKQMSKPAGSTHSNGRREVYILGKNYLLHRIIFLLYNGRFPCPGFEIHHKDGDSSNNSIDNLEEVTSALHHLLSKTKGVCKNSSGWVAEVRLGSKRRWKYFKLWSDARAWYQVEHAKNLVQARKKSDEKLAGLEKN